MRQKWDKLRCQNGFTTTLMLIMIPIIIMSYFGFTLSTVALSVKRRNELKCEQAVMEAQDFQAKQLRSLLSLNPPAYALRAQRRAAELALKVAEKSGVIKAIIAARIALQITKSKQVAHAGKQKAILLASNEGWNLAKRKLKLQISSSQSDFSFTSPNSLPVRSYGADTGSPVYKTNSNFQLMERAEISWKATAIKNSSELKRVVGKSDVAVPILCAGTIKKVRSKWVAVLTPAK